MKMHYLSRESGLLAVLLLVLGLPLASAHHSAAPFDMEKTVTVSGTVEKWVWSNPHSWLYISVVESDGKTQIWGIEAGSAGMLARSGWNSKDMKAGDKVVVTAHPSRNGKPVALIESVLLESGRVLGGGFGAPPPGFEPPAGAEQPPKKTVNDKD